MITAEMVKELRERTGTGMMECKKVLVEADGNMEKAIELLRERGLAKAAKRSGRVASEGLVESYIHGNGRIGVLVEVNSETDFVARNDEFREFVKDVAMQIAAANPQYVKREDVPAEVVEKEMAILKQQALNEGKPEAVVGKIIEGRIDKFYKEICLIEQDWVKNPDKTIKDLLNEKISSIGENLTIRRFARFERGESAEANDAEETEE